MNIAKHILIVSMALTPLISQATTSNSKSHLSNNSTSTSSRILKKISHQLLSMQNIQTNAWNHYFYGSNGKKQANKVLLNQILAEELKAAKQRQAAIAVQQKTNQLLAKLVALQSKPTTQAGVSVTGYSQQQAAEQKQVNKNHVAAENVKAQDIEQDTLNQYYESHPEK